MNSSSLFGPSVAAVWGRKGGRRGVRKSRTGTSSGATLPPAVAAALGEAELHFINGNNEKAIEMLSEVSLKAPKLAEPYSILALIYESSGDLLKALQLYVLTATYTPKANSLHQWTKVAELAAELGELDQAIFALKRCINQNPVPELYQEKIRMFLRQKNINNAKSTLSKLLERFENQEHFIVEFGNIALSIGYSDLAIGSYVRYIVHLLGSQQLRTDLFPTAAVAPNQPPKHTNYILARTAYLYEALYKAVDALLDKSDGMAAAMEVVEVCGEWTLAVKSSLPLDANLRSGEVPELPILVVIMYAVCKLRQEEDGPIAEGMNMLKNVFGLVDQGELLPHLLQPAAVGSSAGSGSSGGSGAVTDVSSADTLEVYSLEALCDDLDMLRQLTRTAVELARVGVATRAAKLVAFLETCLHAVGRKQIVREYASLQASFTATERTVLRSKVEREVPQLWCQLAATMDTLSRPTQALAAYQAALKVCPHHAVSLAEYAHICRTTHPAEVASARGLLDQHVAVRVQEFDELRRQQEAGPVPATGALTVVATRRPQPASSSRKRAIEEAASEAAQGHEQTLDRLRQAVEASIPVTQEAMDADEEEVQQAEGGDGDEAGEGEGSGGDSESGEDFDIDSDLGLQDDGSESDGSASSSSASDDEDLDAPQARRGGRRTRGRGNRAASQQAAQMHWRLANKTTQFTEDDLRAEILALVEWSRLLFDAANAHMFCAVTLPLVQHWIRPSGSGESGRRGGEGSSNLFAPKLGRKVRNKEAHTVSMYQLALTESATPGEEEQVKALWAMLDDYQRSVYSLVSALVQVVRVDLVLNKDALLGLAADLKTALEKLNLPTLGADLQNKANLKSIEKFSYSGGRQRTSTVKYVEYTSVDAATAAGDEASRKLAFTGAVGRAGSPTGPVVIAWNKIRRPVEDPLITAAGRMSERAGALARQLFETPDNIQCANEFYTELLRCHTAGGAVELQVPLSRLPLSAPRSSTAHYLAGHEYAALRKHALAIEKYTAAFCLDPTQPIIALTLGSYLLMLAQHKLTKQRHEVMFKGIAFLHRYLTLRRKEVSAEVAQAAESCIQMDREAAAGGAAQSSAASRSSSSGAGAFSLPSLGADEEHELALYQETCYNLGRAFQDMNLPHLACEQYQQALALASQYDFLKQDDRYVTRQAAHNLVQIYRQSGAKNLALEVMENFLTDE